MRSASQDALTEIIETILRESPFGDVAASAVVVTEGIGPDDEPYLHLTVSAADPDPERGTWSREGVFALRSRVSELAARTPVELPPLVVDVYPESADDLEGDADQQDAQLAEDLDEESR